MNIHRFDLYINPRDIYDKIEPKQRERIGNIVIVNAQLFGDGCVHIECAALDKGIEITSKEPAYRQNLIGNGYIKYRDFYKKETLLVNASVKGGKNNERKK